MIDNLKENRWEKVDNRHAGISHLGVFYLLFSILCFLNMPLAYATYIPITVEESDASPSAKQVKKIKVSNGTLTDDGSGTVTINTAGTGDVTAASTIADNAVVRGDGGAKGVQTSGVIIDDTNNITGVASLTAAKAGLPFDIQNSTDGTNNQMAIFRANDRATAAASDKGYLSFYADDSAGTSAEFGRMILNVDNPAAASKGGSFIFQPQVANSLTTKLTIGSSVTVSGAFYSGSAEVSGNAVTSGAAYAIGGAANGSTKLSLSNVATAILTGYSAAGAMINPGWTEAGSGNHPLIANLAIKSGSITGAAATVSDTAGLYIEDAPNATVSGQKYALWSDAGINRFDGITGINDASPDAYLDIDNTTATADSFGILHSSADSGINAAEIAFTQLDDADALDTNAAINIAVTSSSGDAGDLLQGINLATITGGAATERAIQIGTGWDSQISLLEGGASPTYYTHIKTADQTQASDISYTLPPDDGNSGDFLKTDGAGVLTWASGSSGANTALSNLASVAINTSLISDTDSTDDLGSAGIAWANVYADVYRSGTGNPLILDSASGTLDIDDTTIDLSTQAVGVTLKSDAANGLNFDSNTLSIDALNNRVGIGTATPAGALQVTGDIIASTTIYAAVGFANSSSGNNAYYQSPTTGAKITRNIADANPSLIVQQVNASSTGDVLQLKNNANTLVTVQQAGNVGIGDATPDGLLDVEPTGAVTASTYGLNLSNLVTNTTTDGVNKYGAYLTSTGSFTGSTGTATNNWGLYVDTVSGADNNYAAYISGATGIGTSAPSSQLDIEKTGTAKANLDIFEVTNSVNASDMDATATSLLFNQFYYDATTPAVVDAAKITAATETDWTSTAATQDSYLALSTVLDGAMTEYMRIASTGAIGLSGANYGNSGQVLTSNGSGAAPTWQTMGGALGLDFDDFENTMDLDANLILNQTTYTWTQNFTGTTTAGLTYNANSLTSGTGLAVASSSAGLTTGGAVASVTLSGSNAANIAPVLKVVNSGTLNANAAMMVTNAADASAAESFRVNDDGTDTDSTPFVIDETGNVGVGATAPGAKVDISNAGETLFNITNTNASSNSAWGMTVGSGGQYGHGIFAIGPGTGAPAGANSVLRLNVGGVVDIGNSTTSTIRPIAGTLNIDANSATSSALYQMSNNNQGSLTGTSGSQTVLNITQTFAPTSGTAAFYDLYLAPTINQTGTATGDYSILKIRPIITASTGTNKYLLQAGTSALPSLFVLNEGGSVGVNDATPDARLDIDNTTATIDSFGILHSSADSGINAAEIAFTQLDDADASDTNAAINITTTSSSGDADTLQGINLATITAGAATERAIQIGAGWDRQIALMESVGATYFTTFTAGDQAADINYTLPTANASAFLKNDGSGGLSWTNTGIGDVTGPGSSTDTAIARFNGTGGKTLQNSGVTIDASNNVAGVGTLAVAGAITNSAANSKLYFSNESSLAQITSDVALELKADENSNTADNSETYSQIRFFTDRLQRGVFSEGGNFGVGDTTPDARLDVEKSSTSTSAAAEMGTELTFSDTGIVTTGTDTTTGLDLNVTRTGATGGAIDSIGLDVNVTADSAGSGTSTATGLVVAVSGADTNYGAAITGGNVGIGTTTPGNRLHVTINDAATATRTDVLKVEHTSTGIVAANFGTGILFNGERSDGTNGAMGYISAAWSDPTVSQEDADFIIAPILNSSGTGTERLRIASTGAIGLDGANYGNSGQVLTSNGSGAAPTWQTMGGALGLDFDDFENTMDLDANLILNQTTYTWTQNFTGTTTAGLTYNANSLTSGTGLAVASSSAGLTTGGAVASVTLSGSNAANVAPVLKVVNSGTLNANAAMMVTNAADASAAESFRVNDDGTDTDSTPFVIDETGNVGIGTGGPTAKFHIVSTVNGINPFYFRPSQGNYDLYMNDYGTMSAVAGNGADWAVFGTSMLGAGDSYQRLTFGLDSGTPFLGMGPGNATRDTFIKRVTGGGLSITGGNVGIGTTAPDRRLHSEVDDASASAVTYADRLTHTTSGTPANNIGVGLEFEAETSANNNEIGATIEAVAVDATAASEDFDIVFKNMAAGAAAAETLRIKSTGIVQVTKALASGVFALTDAAPIATDASLGNVFTVSSAVDRTLGVPTNPTSGQKCIWRWKNTDVSAHTLTLTTGSAGAFRFGSTITTTSATPAGKTDYIGAIYNAADDRWDVIAYTKGY